MNMHMHKNTNTKTNTNIDENKRYDYDYNYDHDSDYGYDYDYGYDRGCDTNHDTGSLHHRVHASKCFELDEPLMARTPPCLIVSQNP